MNKVILMGRLTRDPDIRVSSGANQMTIARYTLAVDRRMARRDGDSNQQTADFIGCVAFNKSAEFAERYLKKGTKVVVTGRIQTGSYQKDGQTIYTTDVIVEDQEFAESKNAQSGSSATGSQGGGYYSRPQEGGSSASDGFMNIPDGVEDEGLPFN